MTPNDMSGYFTGVASDHTGALLAPILLPLAVWIAFRLLTFGARCHWRAAVSFTRRYEQSGVTSRIVALLLLLAGAIHFALIPGHLAEPVLAVLFALNGVAFVAVAGLSFAWRRWRFFARLLIWLTLVAYLGFLATGQESPDLVGSATYLLELLTLAVIRVAGLAAIPQRLTGTGETAPPAMLTGKERGLPNIQDEASSHELELAR